MTYDRELCNASTTKQLKYGPSALCTAKFLTFIYSPTEIWQPYHKRYPSQEPRGSVFNVLQPGSLLTKADGRQFVHRTESLQARPETTLHYDVLFVCCRFCCFFSDSLALRDAICRVSIIESADLRPVPQSTSEPGSFFIRVGLFMRICAWAMWIGRTTTNLSLLNVDMIGVDVWSRRIVTYIRIECTRIFERV